MVHVPTSIQSSTTELSSLGGAAASTTPSKVVVAPPTLTLPSAGVAVPLFRNP